MHNPFSTYLDTHIMHNPGLCKMCVTDLCAYVGSLYGYLCICSFLVCGRVSRESQHKIQCRGSFSVGSDTHLGQKLATF
jgi:hypothetical protein